MSNNSFKYIIEEIVNQTRKHLDIIGSSLDNFSSIVSQKNDSDRRKLEISKKHSDVDKKIMNEVKNHQSFNPDWEYPSRVGHLDLNIIKTTPDKLSNAPDIPGISKDDFVVGVKVTRNLTNESNAIILQMNSCFEFISKIIYQDFKGYNKEIADRIMAEILNKVQNETGWTRNDALLAIFIRDLVLPSVQGGYISEASGLEDTIAICVVENDELLIATLPYHSPSIKFNEIAKIDIQNGGNDDYGQSFEGGYGEEYPPGDFDLGDPI